MLVVMMKNVDTDREKDDVDDVRVDLLRLTNGISMRDGDVCAMRSLAKVR